MLNGIGYGPHSWSASLFAKCAWQKEDTSRLRWFITVCRWQRVEQTQQKTCAAYALRTTRPYTTGCDRD